MEEEEREAQSAKLQELIRRGAPEDLQEANRLMKIMAGYDTRSKTDYRAKAAEDVGKIQAKARLLEERLAAFQPGDTMADGDVFDDMAASLQSAQPKIQKMCEEESDDHEAVAKLLDINDSIHRTVERWKLLKKGDIEGANKLAQGAPIPTPSATSGKAKSSAANELSLIDFDGDMGTNGTGSAAASSSQAAGVENDLLGLSLGDSTSSFGQGGGISLGFGANQSPSTLNRDYGSEHLTNSIIADIPGPALLSSLTQNSTAKGPTPTPTPPPFSPYSGFSSKPSASQSATPQPPLGQYSAFSQPPPKASDPFVALSAAQFSSKPTSPQPPAATAASNEDDEWSFSSALPPEASAPREHQAVVSNTLLRINMKAVRAPQSPNALSLLFSFSNTSPQQIANLHFQLAVTKVGHIHAILNPSPGSISYSPRYPTHVHTYTYPYTRSVVFLDSNQRAQGYELKLQPQTGRILQPNQDNGVTQAIQVWHAGDATRKVDSARLRWRVSYTWGADTKTEMGDIPEFSIV